MKIKGTTGDMLDEPAAALFQNQWQIELRVAALVAAEAVMINAFKERIDLHSKIAAVSLQIARVKVTTEQRDIGKTINFGFLYGPAFT